jgi:signal peptidase II
VNNRFKKIWLVLGLNLAVLILFVADRVLKFFIRALPPVDAGGIFLLGDFLKLRLAFNPGLAFGIKINFYLIILFYLAIILILIWFLAGSYKKFFAGGNKSVVIFSLSLIIAGAGSNLLDRLWLGRVVDYFDLKYYSVFNLADVLICLGAVFILVDDIFCRSVSKK